MIKEQALNKLLEESLLNEEIDKNRLINLAVLAVLGVAGVLYLRWYMKQPDKIYAVLAILSDDDIQKIRSEISKRGLFKTYEGLKEVTLLLKHYADSADFGTLTFKVIEPIHFIRTYASLMAKLKAYYPQCQCDGFFTSDEVVKLYRIASSDAFKKQFCRVYQYTKVEKDKSTGSERHVTVSEESCDDVYDLFISTLEEAIHNRKGVYFGAATDEL